MDAAELDLVRRARAGDPEAFGGLVERYSRLLWRAAYSVLSTERAVSTGR